MKDRVQINKERRRIRRLSRDSLQFIFFIIICFLYLSHFFLYFCSIHFSMTEMLNSDPDDKASGFRSNFIFPSHISTYSVINFL